MREPKLLKTPKENPPRLTRDRLREMERQFRGFLELEDEAGYWAWLSVQPGYDPEDPQARQRAADAWKEALAERKGWRRRS